MVLHHHLWWLRRLSSPPPEIQQRQQQQQRQAKNGPHNDCDNGASGEKFHFWSQSRSCGECFEKMCC
ncbi:hypothetical protein JHK86_031992 [Glycine max]|nr:hypothetical protein JHK86_031992 [Glycine max]